MPLVENISKCALGGALIWKGEYDEGYQQLKEARESMSMVSNLNNPFWYGVQAVALARLGQSQEALELTDLAITESKSGEIGWALPEIMRSKGEVLLSFASPDTRQAEQVFRQSIDLAKSHKAKSWELRSAMSLARLWQSQDKTQDAHELLTPVYDWFTEGFDTADLKDAKALLEELK